MKNGKRETTVSDNPTCKGFSAAGVAAAIKKPGVFDLGLICSEVPATAAGVFTRNLVKAAPVVLTQQRIGGGTVRAVIANAGNANCCTGPQGMEDARSMAAAAADSLGVEPEQVLVASTGVIGKPLPVSAIRSAAPGLASALRPDGFGDFARAIMTTDTVPKLVMRKGEWDGKPFSLVCAAKGAGMIRPDMATMLCFICTDLAISHEHLQPLLAGAVDRTLNRITIDGDTSTNDMVVLLANGVSGVTVETADCRERFRQLLEDVLMDIARRLVKDGEGVTKVVEIRVRGAATDKDAEKVADAVAHSPLVKTAFFGEDANWGRIIGAVGRAGVPLDPDRIDLYFNDILMAKDSQGRGRDAEDRVTAVMKQSEFSVTVDLKSGSGEAFMLTSDFSVDYVKINADYRT